VGANGRDATQTGPDREKPKGRSPQEAFDGLRTAIEVLQAEVRDVAQTLKDHVTEVDHCDQAAAMMPAIESLFEIHDVVFTKVIAMESGKDAPDGFVVNLLENVEGELARHGIQVIRPRSGEKINLEVMSCTGSARCAWWREPNTVARVHQCGFAQEDDDTPRVLRKARVDVYRRM